MCTQKFESSGVPIRTLTPKKVFNYMIKNNSDSSLKSFERFFMTFLSARSNLVNFALIKKIDSSFVPIKHLTKISIFQSDQIISWDLSSYWKKIWSKRPNMPKPEIDFFFWCIKKNESSGVAILLLTEKKNQSHRSKHYEESLNNFWAIFDDCLQR